MGKPTFCFSLQKRYIKGTKTVFMRTVFRHLLHAAVEYRIRLKNAPPSANREMALSVNVYFWGLKRPTIPVDNCFGNGLSSVTVRKSLLQFLIGIVTLGIVAPLTIAWECAKDNTFREPLNPSA